MSGDLPEPADRSQRVGSAELRADSVTAAKIPANAAGSSGIEVDAVKASEIEARGR
ncbi:MAG: hypothetical protein ACRDLO_01220 [Solirubrobacterales bacterium]